MDKLRCAVVGLGIGRAHAEAYEKCERAELYAVCDIRPERFSRVDSINPNVKKYTSFDELLADENVDAVSICLPSSMHAEFAVRAMEAGKHVLVEKPLDITVKAAQKIEDARLRTGMTAGVVHQNRNNVCMKPIKDAVDDGTFGKIFLGTFAVKWYRDMRYFSGDSSWHGTWAVDGGGSLMNQAVHTVDIMRWLMGDVVSVSSRTGIYNHDIETEDCTASVISFASGAMATFVSTTCAYPGICTEIAVYGTEGSAEADADVLKSWKVKLPEDSDFDTDELEDEMLAKFGKGNRGVPGAVTAHFSVINDFVDAVLDKRDPQILPREAIKAVEIVNAIYESAKTGQTVFLK